MDYKHLLLYLNLCPVPPGPDFLLLPLCTSVFYLFSVSLPFHFVMLLICQMIYCTSSLSKAFVGPLRILEVSPPPVCPIQTQICGLHLSTAMDIALFEVWSWNQSAALLNNPLTQPSIATSVSFSLPSSFSPSVLLHGKAALSVIFRKAALLVVLSLPQWWTAFYQWGWRKSLAQDNENLSLTTLVARKSWVIWTSNFVVWYMCGFLVFQGPGSDRGGHCLQHMVHQAVLQRHALGKILNFNLCRSVFSGFYRKLFYASKTNSQSPVLVDLQNCPFILLLCLKYSGPLL